MEVIRMGVDVFSEMAIAGCCFPAGSLTFRRLLGSEEL